MEALRVGVSAGGDDVAALFERHVSVLTPPAAAAASRPARAASLGPLLDAVIDGLLDVVVFTSTQAVATVLAGADRRRDAPALLRAFAQPVAAAALDPGTAAALEDAGIPVSVMPLEARAEELVRAVQAWHRRGGRERTTHALRLQPASCSALLDGHRLALGERSFAVLASLVRRPEVVCPLGVIVHEAWGADVAGGSSSAKHQVARLRRKLGRSAAALQTVRGVGYRFAPACLRSPAAP